MQDLGKKRIVSEKVEGDRKNPKGGKREKKEQGGAAYDPQTRDRYSPKKAYLFQEEGVVRRTDLKKNRVKEKGRRLSGGVDRNHVMGNGGHRKEKIAERRVCPHREGQA